MFMFVVKNLKREICMKFEYISKRVFFRSVFVISFLFSLTLDIFNFSLKGQFAQFLDFQCKQLN